MLVTSSICDIAKSKIFSASVIPLTVPNFVFNLSIASPSLSLACLHIICLYKPPLRPHLPIRKRFQQIFIMSQYQVPGQGWFHGHQCLEPGSAGPLHPGNALAHFTPQQRLPGHVHSPQISSANQQQQYQPQQQPFPMQQQYQTGNTAFNVPPQQYLPFTSGSNSSYRPLASTPPSHFGQPNADNLRFFDLMSGWGTTWGLPQKVASYLSNGARGPIPDLHAFNAQREANLAAGEYQTPQFSIADPSSVLSQLRYDGENILSKPWINAGPEHGPPLPVPDMLPPMAASLPMDIYQPGLQGLVGQGRTF